MRPYLILNMQNKNNGWIKNGEREILRFLLFVNWVKNEKFGLRVEEKFCSFLNQLYLFSISFVSLMPFSCHDKLF